MRKTHLWILLCLFTSNSSFAQNISSEKTINALSVGDTLPMKYFEQNFAGEGKTVRLSDYKGKMLILDLWDKRCRVCIANMPKLQTLQNQFSKDVQVILITKNSDEEVANLKKRIRILAGIKLPLITRDSIFQNLFPLGSVPTHVWIDEKRVVRQITESWNTTSSSLQKQIAGITQHLPVKSGKKKFDSNMPLWLEGGGRQIEKLQYYSFITKHIPDYAHSSIGFTTDSISKRRVGIKLMNLPVKELFAIAYGWENRQQFMKPFRIINATGDLSLNPPVDATEKEIWMKKNSFCYELRLMPRQAPKLFEVMQQDLERFFEIKVCIEKRNVKCLVFKTKENHSLRSCSDIQVAELSPDYREIILQNAPFTKLVKYLEIIYWQQGMPLLDETDFKDSIDVTLEGELSNLPYLKMKLKKYGVQLTEEVREIEMLVLRSVAEQ